MPSDGLYAQKVRPPKGTQGKNDWRLKTVIEGTLGTILYLRYLLPSKQLETASVWKSLVQDPNASQPATQADEETPGTQLGEESTICNSIERGNSYRKVTYKRIKPGAGEQADMLLMYIGGVVDAIGEGYLKSFTLYIFLDKEDPENIVEAFTIDVDYLKDSTSQLSLTARRRGGCRESSDSIQPSLIDITSNESVYQSLKAVLQNLSTTCHQLEDLPAERYIGIKLAYVEGTPQEYEPSGFRAATGMTLRMGVEGDQDQPICHAHGSVGTGKTKVSVRSASIAHALPGFLPFRRPHEQQDERRHRISKNTKDAISNSKKRKFMWDLDDTINLPQENPQQVVVSMPVPSESYKESMMDLSALRGRPSMTYTFGTFHRRIEDGAVSLNNQDIEEELDITDTQEKHWMPIAPAATLLSSGGLFGPALPPTASKLRSQELNHNPSSNDTDGLMQPIDSDPHTESSSQEYDRKKDTFQPLRKLSLAATAKSRPAARSASTRKPATTSKASRPFKARFKSRKAPQSAGQQKKTHGKKPQNRKPKVSRGREPSTAHSVVQDVKCHCGDEEGDELTGQWIYCDGCKAWMHAVCLGILRPVTNDKDEKLFCVVCRVQNAHVGAMQHQQEEELLDKAHMLVLTRRVLYTSRHQEELLHTQNLAEMLATTSENIDQCIAVLENDGFFKASAASHGTRDYVNVKDKFSSYFRPGGYMEHTSLGAPFEPQPSTQITNSQATPAVGSSAASQQHGRQDGLSAPLPSLDTSAYATANHTNVDPGSQDSVGMEETINYSDSLTANRSHCPVKDKGKGRQVDTFETDDIRSFPSQIYNDLARTQSQIATSAMKVSIAQLPVQLPIAEDDDDETVVG